MQCNGWCFKSDNFEDTMVSWVPSKLDKKKTSVTWSYLFFRVETHVVHIRNDSHLIINWDQILCQMHDEIRIKFLLVTKAISYIYINIEWYLKRAKQFAKMFYLSSVVEFVSLCRRLEKEQWFNQDDSVMVVCLEMASNCNTSLIFVLVAKYKYKIFNFLPKNKKNENILFM